MELTDTQSEDLLDYIVNNSGFEQPSSKLIEALKIGNIQSEELQAHINDMRTKYFHAKGSLGSNKQQQQAAIENICPQYAKLFNCDSRKASPTRSSDNQSDSLGFSCSDTSESETEDSEDVFENSHSNKATDNFQGMFVQSEDSLNPLRDLMKKETSTWLKTLLRNAPETKIKMYLEIESKKRKLALDRLQFEKQKYHLEYKLRKRRQALEENKSKWDLELQKRELELKERLKKYELQLKKEFEQQNKN